LIVLVCRRQRPLASGGGARITPRGGGGAGGGGGGAGGLRGSALMALVASTKLLTVKPG